MSAYPKLTDLGRRRRLRSRILGWYDRHGRKLPWRESADPYRIWISEIMLQQTTVAAVLPYFERFMAQFPDVYALAAAEQSDVLRAWEGPGYYSRARNLHKAAQTIVNDYEGRFPETSESDRGHPESDRGHPFLKSQGTALLPHSEVQSAQ
ncbi:MAG: hypothetical protein R3C49_00585 [Planctomycetaceae bacterium]